MPVLSPEVALERGILYATVESRSSGVPGPAPHELRRERLLEALHKHRARPLVLLVAAAGYGKSTLAATYARVSGGSVVWLALAPTHSASRHPACPVAPPFQH